MKVTDRYQCWNILKSNIDVTTTVYDLNLLPKLVTPTVSVSFTMDPPSESSHPKSNHFKASNISMQVFTPPQAIKQVISVKFDVNNDDGWRYEAGDAFGIFCENSPLAVQKILELLRLTERQNEVVQVTSLLPTITPESLLEAINGKSMALLELFTKYVDLNHFPKKAMLRHLAEFCTDEADRMQLLHLCSKTGSSDYMALAHGHANIIDFLHSFPSCIPTLECLLTHITLLHPRFYSICSASNNSQIEFIYTTMDYTMPNGLVRIGSCTSWLERCRQHNLNIGLEFTIIPRPSPHFRLQSDPNIPVIMICAGTGISPFIGFLRSLQVKRDNMWLIYGFRHREHDYLFKNELERFESKGFLTNLSIATSREPDSGHFKYVQDILHMNSKIIYEMMIEKGAVIYICGDELTMIKSVNDTLLAMIMEESNVTVKEAQQVLQTWNTSKRIIRDVWV